MRKKMLFLMMGISLLALITVNPTCPEKVEICDNGVDDDGDGFADCRDDECTEMCPEDCGNQLDDDFDGSIDCDDEECWADGGEKKFSISEIMYDPTGNEVQQEWVEVCNESDKCADASGFTIADGSSITPTVFQEGLTFRAGQCKTVSNNPVNIFECHVQTHVQWTIEITLNNEGDSVTLKDAEGNTLDKMVYSLGMTSPGKSLEKCKDDSGKAFYQETNAAMYECGNFGSPELPNACD